MLERSEKMMERKETIQLTDDDLNLINGGNALRIDRGDGSVIVLVPPEHSVVTKNFGKVISGKDLPGKNKDVFETN